MNVLHGHHAIALPHDRRPAPAAPSEATVFREGGPFHSPGIPGSGSVAACARCGGDLPLSGPFLRVVLHAPLRYRYEHPGRCSPTPPPLRLAPG